MPLALDSSQQKRLQKVERIAGALVSLARGDYTAEVARAAGVSTVTILNWMDWSWKHRAETEEYLLRHYPDLTREELASLWTRIEHRRAKRQRRLDLTGVLSSKEPGGE
jgi:hypothetical protein